MEQFEKIWKEWCKKLSLMEKDLFSILDDVHTEISRGKDEDAWFKDAKFYHFGEVKDNHSLV